METGLVNAIRTVVRELRIKALDSREEAGRIRRTIKAPTGAEERCFVRAEAWDGVADQLETVLMNTTRKEAHGEEETSEGKEA